MELSFESRRSRWTVIAIVCGFAAAAVFAHAQIVRDYLNIVGQLGLRGAPTSPTPFKQAYPAFAADAQTWVRHAAALLEGDSLQLRHTTIDNAPFGREVHWNSAWAWAIAVTGWVDHWLSDTPLLTSLERITLWLNPSVLCLLVLLFGSWTARRAGAAAAVVVACAMVCHPRLFEGFFPSYVDHHGLLAVAVLGVMLGATFMGAGWWRETPSKCFPGLLPASLAEARQAAIFSALSGAIGMWVSAASQIVPIAIVGVSGLVILVLRGRDAVQAGDRFAPELWRTWGRVGAVASFGFYLVEYFPHHLGLRLESNHPFYSLAWWAAGELIAQAGERWLGPPSLRWQALHRLAAPGLALLAAPVTIALGKTSVFVVLDPFLARLHQEHIQEFLPLWNSVRGAGWQVFFSVVVMENVALVAGIVVLAKWRRRAPLLLWFGTVAALAFSAMAWMQSRWLLNAAGSQVTLSLVLLACFLTGRKAWVRWMVTLVAVSVLYIPMGVNRVRHGLKEVRERQVTPKDAQSALARDVAAAIRASQPEGEIVLLTSPNSSTAVGYYGRFKTLGTLYWENVDGLKAAAAILSTKSNEEAATLIRKHGVTHIAMISEENFVGPYYMLLNPGAKLQDAAKSFGYQLLIDRVVPPWLQMVPYAIPADLKSLNVGVLLFKVAFEQTPADALYHVALAKVALGSVDEAEADFDMLIKSSPNSFQPYLRKGELRFARQDWQESAEATIEGIRRAPADQRLDLYATVGGNFFRNRQHALAARIYEAALAETFNAEIAAFLAYVLATSSDDAVRNGARAVAVAEKALAADPKSSTVMNSLAVALAESGKFPEALTVAERALAQARVQNHPDAIRVTEARIAAFKAGKPWRE